MPPLTQRALVIPGARQVGKSRQALSRRVDFRSLTLLDELRIGAEALSVGKRD